MPKIIPNYQFTTHNYKLIVSKSQIAVDLWVLVKFVRAFLQSYSQQTYYFQVGLLLNLPVLFSHKNPITLH
jgi:uncharacterized membrane protein